MKFKDEGGLEVNALGSFACTWQLPPLPWGEIGESYLSVTGFRKITRYEKIEVRYLDRESKKQKQVFTVLTAQIIKHEVDHFEGIII